MILILKSFGMNMYILMIDEEYMKRYKENYVYSDKSIITYKTKKPINIKISFF